jgi:dipeptidyl aminopeptidase/acylaminoacyl peptidase
MKAIAILLALGLAGPLLSSAQAAEVTPELIADLTMEEEVRLSADGKWVSYIVGVESGGEGGRAKELWMASVDGAPVQRRLLPDRSRVLVARWSPDGRLAVIAQSEDTPRRRQLLVLEPGTGVMHVLADRFDGDSVEWSPDGRQLGFVRSESTGPARKRSADEPQVLGAAREGGGSVSRFHTLDVATGVTQARTPLTHSVGDYAWSPRGDGIVTVARPTGASSRPVVTILPFTSGAAPRALWPVEDQTIGLAWSPDGKTVAWCGREFTPGSGQLVLMNAEGEPHPRTVQADFPGSLHHILFRADGRLAFGAQENLRVGIYSVAGDGSDLRADHPAASFAPGSLGVGSFTKFTIAFSADGSRVASMVSGPREPANVIAGPWRGQLTRRTNLNPVVAELALGTVEDIAWRSFDGLQIHGFLVKPPGFDPAKKYPLVVEVHGGPRRSWWATCFLNSSHWAQWLASQGYVVLMPNPRGSEGRGAEFVRANRRDLGGGDWRDVVGGLDHVLTLGYIDPERLVLAGWSYGGYLTAWGIGQPEGQRFKAAIVGAGIINLFTRGGAAGGWSDNHWGDPQAIWRHAQEFFSRSPIAHVNRVTAATLILHGDNDSKVPHSQALEFFNGLRAMGVPTEARIYPGEGHSIGRRDHQIDLLNSIARWLRTYVPVDGAAKSSGIPGR